MAEVRDKAGFCVTLSLFFDRPHPSISLDGSLADSRKGLFSNILDKVFEMDRTMRSSLPFSA